MLELKSPSKVPVDVSRSRAAQRAGPSVRCRRVDSPTLMREATEEPRGNHPTGDECAIVHLYPGLGSAAQTSPLR